MQKYHEQGLFNGTVLVAEKGKVILKKGYGYANMEWEIHNEPQPGSKLRDDLKRAGYKWAKELKHN